MEAWDWYLEKFRDQKVMDALGLPKPATQASQSNFEPAPFKEPPRGMKELAALTGHSEPSVQDSLVRLYKRGKVVFTDDGKWQSK